MPALLHWSYVIVFNMINNTFTFILIINVYSQVQYHNVCWLKYNCSNMTAKQFDITADVVKKKKKTLQGII